MLSTPVWSWVFTGFWLMMHILRSLSTYFSSPSPILRRLGHSPEGIWTAHEYTKDCACVCARKFQEPIWGIRTPFRLIGHEHFIVEFLFLRVEPQSNNDFCTATLVWDFWGINPEAAFPILFHHGKGTKKVFLIFPATFQTKRLKMSQCYWMS